MKGPPPNRQQLAMLRALAARERHGHLPRVAALPEELTSVYAGNYAARDIAALPPDSAAARNRLARLVKRGWVHVLFNSGGRSYELTDEGREVQK